MPERAAKPDDVLVKPVAEVSSSALPSLSDREQEIGRLLSEGMSNMMIAQALQVSEATAKVYVRSLMRKLRAPNRMRVVALMAQKSPKSAVENSIAETATLNEARASEVIAHEIDDILLRLETGIAREKQEMGHLLARLRTTLIAA